jgi:hypothetical protein
MRYYLYISLFLALISSAFSQNQLYDNNVYANHIHAVKMEIEGWEISYPVIELNSGNQLLLSFDDFSNEHRDYSYKIIHCNADWQPSSLAENEYLDGFFENQIDAPRSSFNTFKNYFHYKLNLPNDQIQIKSSGNYIIKVYENYDQEQVVLTRRFSIYENIVGIGANIQRSILSKYRATHQQVDIKLLTEGLEISDPYTDLKLAVVQNNNWNIAKTNLQPQFVSNNELIYEDPNENLYKGYNEFRVFDMKSFKYLQDRVSKIFFEDTTYYVRLMDDDDKRFKVYMNDIDINGAYIVRNRDYDDHEVESDYARVYFYLPMPEPVTDGNLYVFGELSDWQISERNKMVYNYQKHAYQLMMELKQGYYNYQYVFATEDKSVFEPDRVEGSHHETENNYLIYVYAKLFGDMHDRLVGFSIVNSSKDNETILGN